VGIEEKDEDYRPYDTLKAIGFTKDEAKGLLSTITDAGDKQLPPTPKKPPDVVVSFSQQRAERRARLRKVLLIVWGYAVAIWLYVIALQLFYPVSIYWPLATWLPIRVDYVGEGAFIFSFFVATAIVMWGAKRITRPLRPDSDSTTPTGTPRSQ